MFEFENGCEKQETLEMYNMFMSSPHVTRCTMMVNEEPTLVGLEPYEELVVDFMMYETPVSVLINTTTNVGEVSQLGLHKDEVIGFITVDRLLEFLSNLPHICYYLEETVSDGIVH